MLILLNTTDVVAKLESLVDLPRKISKLEELVRSSRRS